jgi:chromosome segregation ATPase
MARSLEDLEREFYVHRDKILKEMDKKEQPLRRELGKLTKQVSVLKEKRKQVQLLDGNARKKMCVMQQKLESMRRHEKEDAKTIVYMKNRIRQLKKEIPVLERNIKKTIPERSKIAKEDRKLTKLINSLGSKIAKKQVMINVLKSKVKKLDRKEDFIKHGTIVWGEFKPKKLAKKKQARKPVKKPKRKPLFGIFSLRR